MLTEAILQLVASGRGIAALPGWAIQPFLDRQFVASRPITSNGLWCELFAATTASAAGQDFIRDFISTMLRTCADQLGAIEIPEH